MNTQTLKQLVVVPGFVILLAGSELVAAPGATGGAGVGGNPPGGATPVAPNNPQPADPDLTPPVNPSQIAPGSPNLTPPGNPNIIAPGSPNLSPPRPNLVPPNPNLTPPGNPNVIAPGSPNLNSPFNPSQTGVPPMTNGIVPMTNGVIPITNGIVPMTNGVIPMTRSVDTMTNGIDAGNLTDFNRGRGTNGFYRTPDGRIHSDINTNGFYRGMDTNNIPPSVPTGAGGTAVAPGR